MEGIPVLAVNEEVVTLASELVRANLLPTKAYVDALHISAAAVGALDYLLTWNCRHIANARILPRVGRTVESLGYKMPFVCTPEELIEEVNPNEF